jgi:type IV secretory pathway VirB2 component (pilin)
MNRDNTPMKIMWALSVTYGALIGIVAALHGPVATVAWVGAIALGLGWTFSHTFTRREAQDSREEDSG